MLYRNPSAIQGTHPRTDPRQLDFISIIQVGIVDTAEEISKMAADAGFAI
jgi:hypothetical protein